MLKIENIEVMGWEAAIRGMRNPMNSWEKSDSGWDARIPPLELRNQVDWKRWAEHYKVVQDNGEHTYDIGPDDRDLMTRLRNAGTDHRKFMRMIAVYLDITAPLYWWKEFDTYKVGTVANSCSTMHKIAAKEFTRDDFSTEHIICDGKAYLANHDNYDTRYDLLISAGDYVDENTENPGPTFKFKDVGVYDLGDGLTLADYIKVGSNVKIQAKVRSYNSDTGLFELDPVSVEAR